MTRDPSAPVRGPETMARRDALRRLGTVGLATVALTPTIQSIGMLSAFAAGSAPPPPPPPPPTKLKLPSNFQILVVCPSSPDVIGIKWDTDDRSWDTIGGGTACAFTLAYRAPTTAEKAYFNINVVPAIIDLGGGDGAYKLTLPSSCIFKEGRPKDGTCKTTSGPHADKCGAPVSVNGDGTYTFQAC